MTSEKDTAAEKEQKPKKVKKATTGAWWKSSSEIEVEETAAPQPKKTAPRRSRKKTTAPATEEKAPLAVLPPAESGDDAAGNAKDKTGEQSLLSDKDQAQKVVADAPAPEKVEVVVSEENQETKPAPSRGRRRGRKKAVEAVAPPADEQKVVTEDQETAATGAEGKIVAGESLESSEGVGKGDARPETPAKRRRRKKKPVEKVQTESEEGGTQEVPVAEGKEEVSPEETAEETFAESTEDVPESSEEDRKEPPVKKKRRSRSGRKKRPESETENEEASDVDDIDADAEDDVEDDTDETPDDSKKHVTRLLINAEEPEECRLALLEDGRLESIHVATTTRLQTKNNIYKAKIVAIEPNLQAAFVDYGTEKNGFLPFSEIHPEYYKDNVSERVQKFVDEQQWKKLSIIDVMEKGRELLVQVVKEEVGKKGANMTTYLSLPGRCVVLMPGSDSTGISRKISGEEKRSQLREYISSFGIPEGIGWILRTASNDITKTALGRDVDYLLKLWAEIKKKGQEMKGVGLLYQDHDHVLRFLREHFDPDIEEITVDSEEALEQVKGFVELLPAKHRNVRCKLHRGARPIFNQFSIEDQIESIYQPKVNLPSGGSIVIDPTEALVAIDVNSGSTQKGANFEETIFHANMEAATELARQLRLRDLGGLVVVDFIDMRSKKHIRDVERQVKAAMKRDKAKVDISRISKFGLMQISRQKLGAPIEAGNYKVCEHCKGRGMVRSVETQALFYLRRIHTGASRKNVVRIECRFPLDVAQYLLNAKRQELRDLELKHNCSVVITADPALKPSDNEILFQRESKEDSNKKRS